LRINEQTDDDKVSLLGILIHYELKWTEHIMFTKSLLNTQGYLREQVPYKMHKRI